PLIGRKPFIAAWNAPLDRCTTRYNISTNVERLFHIQGSPRAEWTGQNITIFYANRLGFYPHYTPQGVAVNGGLPQNCSLDLHLLKAHQDIRRFIPARDVRGLAVIDWEFWRPQWKRNWHKKRIYQSRSVELARSLNQWLPEEELVQLARGQFEDAARAFMDRTLSLGLRLRPSRLWGFYLFPDCYNYGWEEPGYTGRCSNKTQGQNDRLMWLWERSSALFPSVYIAESLGDSPFSKLYVRNRVQEAMRVAELPRRPHTVPVYVYSRPLFRDQSSTFLSQMDLVSTVGEIAALGASGVVMWGSSSDYSSKGQCESLSRYLKSTLAPYLANVTAAAMLCSEVLCQGKGRCTRKEYDSTHYLHLNPAHFTISQVEGAYVATGLPSAADVDALSQHFTCQCYAGLTCQARA
uniref:Hyaluronidase n=1 Tax=Tetraodon nigroviridis TaxID=99883 RepID=H3BXF6_TETNG